LLSVGTRENGFPVFLLSPLFRDQGTTLRTLSLGRVQARGGSQEYFLFVQALRMLSSLRQCAISRLDYYNSDKNAEESTTPAWKTPSELPSLVYLDLIDEAFAVEKLPTETEHGLAHGLDHHDSDVALLDLCTSTSLTDLSLGKFHKRSSSLAYMALALKMLRNQPTSKLVTLELDFTGSELDNNASSTSFLPWQIFSDKIVLLRRSNWAVTNWTHCLLTIC
jgi:hypothetical protein